jgi:phosphatidate cytidylyltransferase
MKTRITSAIIAGIILIPLFIMGGIYFDIALTIIGVLGIREFIDLKEKNIPLIMQIIAYLIFILGMVFINDTRIEFSLIALYLIALLVPVLAFKGEEYSSKDAFNIIGITVLMTLAFKGMSIYRLMDINLMFYLFSITILTDTFAYLVGSKIGKHKMSSISPKKSWEGAIAGSVLATIGSTLIYVNLINQDNVLALVFVTLALSIIGQVGDLFFSSIKRLYNKKDFSNIMPGHGGVLDRLDSIIFVVILYTIIGGLI